MIIAKNITLSQSMFLGYLQYLFEEKKGEERDEAAKKAVLDYLIGLDFEKGKS